LALVPGDRLGSYEITAPIGAGGMGEVYRAKDTKLDRDVAIKVLPRDVSADADRVRRFEQEARATAALSHPNILAVYDIGSTDGMTYVVSELLEGETLREAISQPVPPSRALQWAVQIAVGLAAAHSKRIVHRDIKPENLILFLQWHSKWCPTQIAREEMFVVAPDESQVQPPGR
jgi:serine/threonine protein kinase